MRDKTRPATWRTKKWLGATLPARDAIADDHMMLPVFSRYSRFGTPYVAILVSLWLLVQADLHKILIGLGGLVIAVPFYFLMKKQYLEGK